MNIVAYDDWCHWNVLKFCVFQWINSAAFSEAVVGDAMVVVATNLLFNGAGNSYVVV